MAQYCRYCTWFVTGNGNWCEKKQTERTDRQAKRTNSCRDFDLNPMDAYQENIIGYRPRKAAKKTYQQIRMEGIK